MKTGEAELAPEQPDIRSTRRFVGITLGVFVGVAAFANVRDLIWSGGDLAKGKPWRTSSVFAMCTPSLKSCANTTTAILFHTKEEDGPWFELDLLARRRFSSVTMRNRSDCCPERAKPLIVEVGDDAVTWREVARNEADFALWRATFPEQTARYVRLRIPRLSTLHLEAVEVHP